MWCTAASTSAITSPSVLKQNGRSTSDDPEPVTMFDRARITHEGGANFIVRELLGPGLVNEIGSYEGTVRLSPGGLFGFEVTADGAWTISLE